MSTPNPSKQEQVSSVVFLFYHLW